MYVNKSVMFAVVGDNNLLFSTEIDGLVEGARDKSYLFQFILYASLDSLNPNADSSYQYSIDTYESYSISAYVTIGQTIFLLLHPKRSNDKIKKFFSAVHSLYSQLLMNPFYDSRSPIEDDQFRKQVAACATEYLRN